MSTFHISSLRNKFLVGSAAGLSLLSLLLLLLALGLYQHQLGMERRQASREINRLLQATLENAMLKRDLTGLREIVERLGQQEGILGVMITAPNGEIRFTSRPEWQGRHLEPATIGLDTTGQNQAAHALVSTVFTQDAEGREVMRSINPVRNQEACAGCHGNPAAHPVNGVLVVDYDAAPIRNQANKGAAMLATMGGLILAITLVGSSWFFRNHVLRPVARLSDASRRLAGGDMNSRTALAGQDELAQLGQTFDAMADQLQAHIRQIKKQEAFLQALVDSIPDGIRVIDMANLEIVLDNRAYRALIGQAETQSQRGVTCHQSSQSCATPCPPSLATCPVHEIRRSGQPVKTLEEFVRADGGKTKVEIYAAALNGVGDGRHYIVESSRDLRQAISFSQEQRLAEIARLATGVAHEIHNPLSSIRIALQATIRATALEPERYATIREYLALVDGQIDRCVEVTDRLLKLGMPPPKTAELVDINRAAQETLSLLNWELQENHVAATCQWHVPNPRARATDTEFRLVVLNLVQNALHAMPEAGQLRIETFRDDGEVGLSVEDTGVGIASEAATRIFEPFYSQRADGSHGTGLGLSICRAVIESYGGQITFTSQPGLGSRFVVRLPDADGLLDLPA